MVQPSRIAAESASADANDSSDRGRGLIAALIVSAATACVVLVLWVLGSAQQDPYIKASLELQGAVDHGGQLSNQRRRSQLLKEKIDKQLS